MAGTALKAGIPLLVASVRWVMSPHRFRPCMQLAISHPCVLCATQRPPSPFHLHFLFHLHLYLRLQLVHLVALLRYLVFTFVFVVIKCLMLKENYSCTFKENVKARPHSFLVSSCLILDSMWLGSFSPRLTRWCLRVPQLLPRAPVSSANLRSATMLTSGCFLVTFQVLRTFVPLPGLPGSFPWGWLRVPQLLPSAHSSFALARFTLWEIEFYIASS